MDKAKLRKERNCHTCKRACHLLFLKIAKDMTKPDQFIMDILDYGKTCKSWYDIDTEGEADRDG